jgi:hypothetical protein
MKKALKIDLKMFPHVAINIGTMVFLSLVFGLSWWQSILVVVIVVANTSLAIHRKPDLAL